LINDNKLPVSKNHYIRFTVNILLLLFLILILDGLGGTMLRHFYFSQTSGQSHHTIYTIDSTIADILILGSSRAKFHYDAPLIEKKTGLKTYNCGSDGQGLAFSYIQLFEITKRYNPRLIILDVFPNILLAPTPDDRINILLPFHDRDSIVSNLLVNNCFLEKIKFISKIYPYNSQILTIFKNFSVTSFDSLLGFTPLSGQIDTTIKPEIEKRNRIVEIPKEKFTFLQMIIQLCGNKSIPLLIVVSPLYRSNVNQDSMINQIEHYCTLNKGVIFLNMSKQPDTYENVNFFRDYNHLNRFGAAVFSDVLASVIDSVFNKPYSDIIEKSRKKEENDYISKINPTFTPNQ
jgi:hypothetical protein